MYPLKLSAPIRDYIWGGTRLKTEYGFSSDKEKLAEAWVLSCREDGQSVVLNGELKGKTLAGAIEAFGAECLGKNAAAFRYFPLLIKLIDAKDKLSIQVHPADDYALRNEGEFGKTEMWYVVDAAPGAQLIYGLKRPVSKEELKTCVDEDRITELCRYVPVKKGDVFFIPAGTVHAIGEGILIAEVQQNSNITYRVSDYGRLGADGKPRALHREKAFDVIDRQPTVMNADPVETVAPGYKEKLLASCKYFTVKAMNIDGKATLHEEDSFTSLLVLGGEAVLRFDGGEMHVAKADSLFIPAGLVCTLEGSAELLVSSV